MVDDFTINDTSRRRWEITGILATVVILLTVPLYVLKVKYVTNTADLITREPAASFVGREKCINCHQKEYEKWQNSHHDKAMDEANEKTVLGDFNDAAFELDGITTRFYRKDNKFFVNTQGPGGEMGDFEITYTFGVYPLQQYLVPFSRGRLQCLPIAWDTKEKKWFRLPNGTESMANLQIKGMDDELYANLKDLAASENRSISQQVLFLLKLYLGRKHQFQKIKTPAQILLELSGSWEDPRSPENIIKNLKNNRINSQKLSKGF